MKSRRRKKFLGSAFEKRLLLLMLVAAIAPAGVVATCLYYLIFNIFASEVVIPEFIAYTLIPVSEQVNLILLIFLPVVLAIIWFMALTFSHKISGPLHRLERELDARIKGTRQGVIRLRKGDEACIHSLVAKINKLIAK